VIPAVELFALRSVIRDLRGKQKEKQKEKEKNSGIPSFSFSLSFCKEELHRFHITTIYYPHIFGLNEFIHPVDGG
jgi:hypothetical protein